MTAERHMGEGLLAVEPHVWDETGAHLAAATKIMRAVHRGTGCRLTAAECVALDFAEGDGDWWQQTKSALGLEGKRNG